MGFLAPWFLAGVAAVGLPVWLHLLRKHKTTPLPFSSLMFFEKRTQSSIKHRRLRYLLLFTLRTLLVLLIVLAFARPFVQQRIPPRTRSNEITVLAIDNSLSMRAGTRLADAKAAAKSLVASLRPGERAEVLTFGSRVQVLSEVTDDHAPLNAAIDSIQPSDAPHVLRGTVALGALHRAVAPIAAHRAPVFRHAADRHAAQLQRSAPECRRQAGAPSAGGQRGAEFHRGERGGAAARVRQQEIARAGHHRRLRRAQGSAHVTLSLNGRAVESKTVEVPEVGRATVEFLRSTCLTGATKAKSASIRPTRCPPTTSSTSRWSAPIRARAVRARPDGNGGLLYFKTALDAAGQSAFDVDAGHRRPDHQPCAFKYAFVVLSDVGALPATFENQLRDYVRGGGAVLIALGHHSVGFGGKVPVTGQKILETRYSGREGDRFQVATWLDTSHPSILKDDRWDDVKFLRAIRVDPGDARVVAKLTDQTPLLLDQQMGEGHVVVFASTFDNIDNDFPLHSSFVAFVDQTARYLARMDSGPPSVMVDSFAELRDSKEKGAAVDVLDPKGERGFELDEATKAQNIQFTMAGFYDIRRPNGRNELVAVNADRRESDLTPPRRTPSVCGRIQPTGLRRRKRQLQAIQSPFRCGGT
jgi:hypothetical protein